MSELVAGSGRRPILVVVAGANGSGKTTLTLQSAVTAGCRALTT